MFGQLFLLSRPSCLFGHFLVHRCVFIIPITGPSILKEFVQNADDAGAEEVHFCLDTRQHHASKIADPKLAQFQGPALYVYNSAVFTDRDFESIQNIGFPAFRSLFLLLLFRPGDSQKKDQMNKTGRFGIGFNACYHLTELPVEDFDLFPPPSNFNVIPPVFRKPGSNRHGTSFICHSFVETNWHSLTLKHALFQMSILPIRGNASRCTPFFGLLSDNFSPKLFICYFLVFRSVRTLQSFWVRSENRIQRFSSPLFDNICAYQRPRHTVSTSSAH